MLNHLPRIPLVIAAILLATATLQAQPTLQLTTPTNTYRIGERIPITLIYTDPNADRHNIFSPPADHRRPNNDPEEFVISPSGSGWSDPLAATLNSMGCCGGLFSIGELSSKPIFIHHDLNEWARFDHPGAYTVTAHSRAVSERSQSEGFPFTEHGTPLTSNSIELHIIPATAEWQAQKLQSSLEILNLPAKPYQPNPGREEALADLCFLATPAAIGQLTTLLREDIRSDFQTVSRCLVGLPPAMRPVTIKALNQRLEDPDFPINYTFLFTMADLQLDPTPEASPDETFRAQMKERTAFMASAWQSVFAALPAKKDKARAQTAQTLLMGSSEEHSAAQRSQIAAVLAAAFLDLPRDRQANELQFNWDLLRSEAFLPTLQTLARLPLKNPGSNQQPDYQTREVKAAALHRWFELDPEGARSEAIRQIGSGHPALAASDLAFLPDKSLPEFESTWAEAFAHTTDFQQQTVFAALLARFGAGAATQQVAAALDDQVGKMPCEPQSAALGYLVKFAPESASPLITRALAARGEKDSHCYSNLFQGISAYAHDPTLTQAAIDALNDTDHNVTNDALIYLISYSDESARQPVLERYHQWSETWSGKAAELEQTPTDPAANHWLDLALGQNLAHVLIASQGWLADPALIAEVKKGCLTEQVCQQISQLADSSHNVIVYRDNFQVSQYNAKSLDLLIEKIKQYPQGTTFELIPNSPQNHDQQLLEQQAQTLFTQQGMHLHPANP